MTYVDTNLFTRAFLTQEFGGNITNDQSAINTLQEQLSTGNAVNQPSDNPAAAVSILSLSSQSARASQYAANASNAKAWLGTASTTLNQVLSQLKVAYQATISAGQTQDEGAAALDALASQIDGILTSVTNLANTTYDGQYIFAGTASVAAAYDSTGTYQGNGTVPTSTVSSGVTVARAVTGSAVFGSGTTGLLSTVPGNLGVLAQISADLRSGNVSAVEGTDLGNLQNAINEVQNAAATVGASYDTVQTLGQEATANQTNIAEQLSTVQSVNVAQATTQLVSLQDTYKAALWAMAQISQTSLTSYLP